MIANSGTTSKSGLRAKVTIVDVPGKTKLQVSTEGSVTPRLMAYKTIMNSINAATAKKMMKATSPRREPHRTRMDLEPC